MSDPREPTTWFGLSPAVLLALAAGIGAALTKGMAALWKVITGREANAVLLAENKRLREERDALGMKYDKAKEEQTRMAGAILAYRLQGNDDFGDLPTGIRNMVDLMDPKSPVKALPRDPHASWGANPNPSQPWEPNASTPPGTRKR